MIKILTGFRLEYRENLLLRNFPDRRYGLKGKIKNSIRVFADGNLALDFCGDIFSRPPISENDATKAEEFLKKLSLCVKMYFPCGAKAPPPYLDYVTNYVQFVFSEGENRKFVLDDIDENALSVLKKSVNNFLAVFDLRLDVGERLPQGAVRCIGVVTERSSKEYSYLWDGEIAAGAEVLVPFGAENERVRGKVSSVEYYRTADVPYPLERMKKIIRIENS